MDEKQFKALSVEQRKAVQRKLQDAGHYTGAIDGHWGATTESAIKLEDKADREAAAKAEGKEAAARADKLRETELELKREELRQQGKTKEVQDESTAAETAEKLAKALRRQKYTEQAESIEGVATEIGATAGPLLGGIYAGRKMGQGVNWAMDKSQEYKNKVLKGAAEDRVKGLTTLKGARAGVERSGAMPSKSSVVRVGSRMLPHFGLGGIMAGKGTLLLKQEGEEDPFYPKQANRAQGLGLISTGAAMAERGLAYGIAPGVSPDAQSIAVIESDALRRNNQPDDGPKLTPKQALVAEAKAAGVTGAGKMNMKQLGDALRRIGNKGPLIAPALAGTLAYSATPDDAQAADGAGPLASRGKALTNAGAATGLTAGASYGLKRLGQALGSAGRAAIGAGGTMLTPMIAADAYDPTPEQLNRDRIDIASRVPEWMRVGALGEAGRALMPERNTGKRDEFATARSLEIPEGIPLPQPDGELPPELAQLEAAAAEDPELAQMLQELIAARIGEAQQGQESRPALMSSALRNIAQR